MKGPVVVGTEVPTSARPVAAEAACGTGRAGAPACTHERKTSRLVMFAWLGGDPAEAARLTEEEGRELDALYASGGAVHNRRNSMFLTITPATAQEIASAGARGGSCSVLSDQRMAAQVGSASARPHRWLRTILHPQGDPCHWAYRSKHN